jgi:hypothetical protein
MEMDLVEGGDDMPHDSNRFGVGHCGGRKKAPVSVSASGRVFILSKKKLQSHAKSRAGCHTCKARKVKVWLPSVLLAPRALQSDIQFSSTASVKRPGQDAETVSDEARNAYTQLQTPASHTMNRTVSFELPWQEVSQRQDGTAKRALLCWSPSGITTSAWYRISSRPRIRSNARKSVQLSSATCRKSSSASSLSFRKLFELLRTESTRYLDQFYAATGASVSLSWATRF